MLLKKLINIGTSRAVILPSDFLLFYERIVGKKIEKIGMEISEKKIILRILEDKNGINLNNVKQEINSVIRERGHYD